MSESTVVDMYGGFLTEALVKGSILLVIGLVLVFLLKRSSAATRHAILCSMFASVLLVMGLSLVVPSWSWQSEALVEQTPLTEVAVDHRPLEASEGSAPVESEQQFVVPFPFRGEPPVGGGSWPSVLMGLWGIGVVYFFARMGAGFYLLGRLRSESVPVSDEDVLRSFAVCRSEMGVTREVALRQSNRSVGPLTCGVLSPVVVLPKEATDWSEDRLRAVLLHELAHVRRGDLPARILGQVVCALFWINPLAWLAARRMATERELACDDMVLVRGFDAPSYAEHLVAIAGRIQSVATRYQPALGMARRVGLEDRIARLLRARVNRRGFSRTQGALLLAAVVGLCWPLAGFGLDGDDPETLGLQKNRSLLGQGPEQAGAAGLDAPEGTLGNLFGNRDPEAKGKARELFFESESGEQGRLQMFDNVVMRVHPKANQILWRTELRDSIRETPEVLDGQYLKFGPDNESGFCLDLDSGEQYWPQDTDYVLGVQIPGGAGEYADSDLGLAGVLPQDDPLDLVEGTGELMADFDEDGDLDLVLGVAPAKDPGMRVTLSELGGVSVGDDVSIEATVVKDRIENVTLSIAPSCPYIRVSELVKKLEAAGISKIQVEVQKEADRTERKKFF